VQQAVEKRQNHPQGLVEEEEVEVEEEEDIKEEETET